MLSKEAEGHGNLPGNINLPTNDLKTDGIIPNSLKMPNSDLKINDPSIPAIGDASVGDISSARNPDININVKKDLDKVTNLKDVDKVKSTTNELSTTAGKIDEYTQDIKQVSEGNLEKAKTIKEDAISKLPVNDELTELQKQESLIKEQKAKLESYKKPDEYKKETLARSRKLVALQMATFEKQLQESIESVSKYQRKLGSVLSKTSELSQKRDKLKRLRKYEKFVPGLTFQVLNGGAYMLDINPALKYRLTSYWSIGQGWNERVRFGKHDQSYNQFRVYGIRSFTEVIIFKGLSVRLDAERMSSSIPFSLNERKRIGIWSYIAGIKKDFSFIPRVNGNVQFMYNLYSTHTSDPYANKLNVRFGFEYVRKKNLKN